MSNSSQSTRHVGRVLWEELLEEVKLHITPFMFFIAFKGQVHVFAGCLKIVSHSSCRTIEIEITLSPDNAVLRFIVHKTLRVTLLVLCLISIKDYRYSGLLQPE